MLREPLITNNPFRLLNVASSTTYGALRRKADAAHHARLAGIEEEVPLAKIFGEAGLEEIATSVRALAGDPVARTRYRILWPVDEQIIPLLYEGGTVSANALKPFAKKQMFFLDAWISYATTAEVAYLRTALQELAKFVGDPEFHDWGSTLLVEEDGVDTAQAARYLTEAQNETVRMLLEHACHQAASSWENDSKGAALEVVTTILNSPLDDSLEDKALAPMIAIGDRLRITIGDLTLAGIAWHSELGLTPPIPVQDLEMLANTVAERHPITKTWRDYIEAYYSEVGFTIRNRALDIANAERRFQEAITLYERALSLPASKTFRDRATSELEVLRRRANEKKVREGWEDIKPLKKLPVLRTLNGVGAMLFKGTKFPGDPTLSYATHFLTFFFIPVIPLGRYIAKPERGDSWSFYGVAPWSSYMRWHLGIGLSLVLSAVIAFATIDTSPTPPPMSGDPTLTSTTPPQYGTTLATPIQTEDLQETARLDRLAVEYKRVSAQIKSMNLSSESASIKSDRVQLRASEKKLESRADSSLTDDEIAGYRRELAVYERKLKAFNSRVKRYNARLTRFNQLYDRAKVLDKILTEAGR